MALVDETRLPPLVSDLERNPNDPVAFTYDAYVAYSRLDRRFAQQLQQDLERGFSNISPQFRGGRKELRICRDETDFTASENLPASIQEKLSQAANLIVICSPNARNKSHWVAKEIQQFREFRASGTRRVIAVVLAGDDPLVKTAFPVGLAGEGSQPLAVDFRPQQVPVEIPYKEYVRGDGILRVLAPLLGVEYPILKDRQAAFERAQNRRRLVWAGAITFGFALLALYARNQRNTAIDRLGSNYWSQGVAAQLGSDRLKAEEMYALAADTTRDVGIGADARFAISRLSHGLHLNCRVAHNGAVRGLIEFQSRNQFLTWSDDGTAAVWSRDDCSRIFPSFNHGAPIHGASLDPTETFLLTYSLNGVARLWRMSSGTSQGDPMIQGNTLSGSEFSPNGRWIVTWGQDKTVKLWRIGKANASHLELSHQADVKGVLFSPNGRLLATWCKDESLRVWDVETGMLVGGPWKDAGVVTGAAFRPDGSRLLTWNLFGAADLWDMEHWKPLPISRVARSSGEIASFSPDGSQFLTSSPQGILTIRDGRSGRLICGPIEHEPPGLVDAAFDADGTHVVSWSLSGTARVWNAKDCKPASPFVRPGETINGAFLLQNRNSLLTWDLSDSMRVWDVATGSDSTAPMIHRFHLQEALQDAKTGLVLSRSLNTAQVWDSLTGMAIGPPLFEGDELLGTRFSKTKAAVWTWGTGGFASEWVFDKDPLPYHRLSHDAVIVGIKYLKKTTEY